MDYCIQVITNGVFSEYVQGEGGPNHCHFFHVGLSMPYPWLLACTGAS